MTSSHTKSPQAGHKKEDRYTEAGVLIPAGAEAQASPAVGHSQDTDRHHKVSHEKLLKERGDFEHSDINQDRTEN